VSHDCWLVFLDLRAQTLKKIVYWEETFNPVINFHTLRWKYSEQTGRNEASQTIYLDSDVALTENKAYFFIPFPTHNMKKDKM